MISRNKRLIIDADFIKEALKDQITLKEFLLLSYFDNSFNLIFDLNLIKEILGLSEEEILETYSSLLSKKLIKVEQTKNEDGKICEKISLEPFYENVAIQEQINEKKETKEDIFSSFESEFGRTLSPADYEIINAWIDKGYSEDLIISALQEASYNGVKSLRYIDKILYEWGKKGFTKYEDVKKDWQDNDGKIPLYETKVMEFDWLNENN